MLVGITFFFHQVCWAWHLIQHLHGVRSFDFDNQKHLYLSNSHQFDKRSDLMFDELHRNFRMGFWNDRVDLRHSFHWNFCGLRHSYLPSVYSRSWKLKERKDGSSLQVNGINDRWWGINIEFCGNIPDHMSSWLPKQIRNYALDHDNGINAYCSFLHARDVIHFGPG